MLFESIDFTQKEIKDKLELSISVHKHTWKHYYENYTNALSYITSVGLENKYQINIRSRAYLYLIRHTFELLLKYNLDLQGVTPPPTHNLSNIRDKFPSKFPSGLRMAIDIINKDEDGSCYKYISSKGTDYSYWGHERIEVLNILELYHKPTSCDFYINNICSEVNWKSKELRWEFTCHMNECKNLAQVQTSYDLTIDLLLKGIIDGKVSINDIYLPLLFLIRHSLEIAIKFNLEKLQSTLSAKTKKMIANEHSLSRLFSNYMTYLSKHETSLPSELLKEYTKFKIEYERLNQTIHDLDVNSQIFRYPIDKHGVETKLNIKHNSINEIIELFYALDTFRTFTVDVFHDCEIEV